MNSDYNKYIVSFDDKLIIKQEGTITEELNPITIQPKNEEATIVIDDFVDIDKQKFDIQTDKEKLNLTIVSNLFDYDSNLTEFITKDDSKITVNISKPEIIPGNNSGDNSEGSPENNPGDNPEDKPGNNSGDNPDGSPEKNPGDNPEDKPGNNSGDNPDGNPSGNNGDGNKKGGLSSGQIAGIVIGVVAFVAIVVIVVIFVIKKKRSQSENEDSRESLAL